MSEYVAIYRCRLCGKTYPDSLVEEKEVEKCLWMFQKGKPYYTSLSGRNNVSMIGVHNCGDYRIGISDFCGFKPVR